MTDSTTKPPARRSAAATTGPAPGARAQSHRADAPLPGLHDDIVEEWGRQSFPASDPPANW